MQHAFKDTIQPFFVLKVPLNCNQSVVDTSCGCCAILVLWYKATLYSMLCKFRRYMLTNLSWSVDLLAVWD